MKMILEQASDWQRCEIVEITTLEQILEIARMGKRYIGVVITTKSLLNSTYDDPNIKWHATIYDDFIE